MNIPDVTQDLFKLKVLLINIYLNSLYNDVLF